MQRITSRQAQTCHRLINGGCEPHFELDGPYSSLDEAIADAIAWLEPVVDPNDSAHGIGVDVATGDGIWRTCRPPGLLLCPLPVRGEDV